MIQTKATTLNATASDGGIYLSNNNRNPLTLTAAAVGTASGLTANNIEIYNAGIIVLQQQTTALTQLATSVPVALFSPGGALTLVAGATLQADGIQILSNGGQNITSTTPPATATSTLNSYRWSCSVNVTCFRIRLYDRSHGDLLRWRRIGQPPPRPPSMPRAR